MPETPQPRPLQASWPGLLPWQGLFCAWVLGLLAWQWPLPAASALAIFLWAWLGPDLATFRKRRNHALLLLFLALPAFALGAGVIHLAHPGPLPNPDHVRLLEKNRGQVAQVSGVVKQVLPRLGERLQIILADVVLKKDGQAPLALDGGLLWTWQDPVLRPRPGQTIHASLGVRPIRGMANPGMNRTEDHWARQGVYFRAFSQGTRGDIRLEAMEGRCLREQLRQKFLELTPDGQGQATLLALLTGDRFLMHPDTMDLVRRASLAHSIALSGMHLVFVIALGWFTAHALGLIWPRIYLHLPRPKLAVIISIPLVLGYLWLGQAVPSLLRAALMFASWGLLLLLGHSRILLDGLFLALIAILVLSPLTVFDLSLQLSVLAVAGIALAWPLSRETLGLTNRIWWQKPLVAGLDILAISVVATLALLPLLAWFFGQISPHLYLNVLWLPLLGMVVFPLGFGGLILLMLPGGESLAGMLLSLACYVLEIMLGGLALLDHFGLLAVTVPARPQWPQFIGYWMVLLAAAAWWKNPTALRPGILAAALVLLLTPPLIGLAREQRPEVSLRLLDVGQGQSVLLEAPGGKRWLLDGGGFWGRNYDVGQAVIGPTLTHGRPPRLDGVLLSHASLDHYLGLFHPLRHFQVQAYLSQGRGPTGQDGVELEAILKARDLEQIVLRKGDVVPLGQNLFLEVLHPDDRWVDAANNNNASLVLRLIWHGRPLALILGDAELPALAALLQSGANLRAEVLVIPHHGSRTSFSTALYDQAAPTLALVSAGYLHRFNHPHPEILRALAKRNIPLLNTAEHGAITVRWKNPAAGLEVRTERGGSIPMPASKPAEKIASGIVFQ